MALFVLLLASCRQEARLQPANDNEDSTMQFTSPLTATVTSTPTVSEALTATLRTLIALNIRTGSGLDYPVIGTFAVNAEAVVVGRSLDSNWWKIECPPELNRDDCWVTADPQYAVVDDAQRVSIATVLPPPTETPLPSPTPEPTATPCVASPPAGWIAYTVQPGDTLSGLAAFGGVSITAIEDANCLTDLLANATIFIPASAAVVVPAPIGGNTTGNVASGNVASGNVVNGTQPSGNAPAVNPIPVLTTEPIVPPVAFAATLGFGSPNDRVPSCRCTAPDNETSTAASATITIGNGKVFSWEIGDTLSMCGSGFGSQSPLLFSIEDEVEPLETQTIQSDQDGTWQRSWVIPINARTEQTYTVRAIEATQPVTAAFRVRASADADPKLLTEPFVVTAGTPVVVYFRGFEPDSEINLYIAKPYTDPEGQFPPQEKAYVPIFSLSLPPLDEDGWGVGMIETEDLLPGKYRVWGPGIDKLPSLDCHLFTIQ